ELLAADDHLPLGLDPHVAHERDERVEDLRHAPAERGGAEVEDLQPLQPLGELPDLGDERAADEVGVVREALVTDSDRLQHADGAYSPWYRYLTSVILPSPSLCSSTVAATIARPSSGSASSPGSPGPAISSSSRS